MTARPPWLRGPVDGVTALLQPVAHSLIDCAEDIRSRMPGLSVETIWTRPNNAAAIGFHVRHAIGSLDRLFTYARGEGLSANQLATLKTEGVREEGPATAEELIRAFDAAIERAMTQLRSTGERDLLAKREVGRAKLPSNVIGLLCHAAEHTQRHVAQMTTTAKILSLQSTNPPTHQSTAR
jgi:uncharacterized damage-inducible protein DinB